MANQESRPMVPEPASGSGQNLRQKALSLARGQVEAWRARYFNFYDIAPVGYLTLSEQGLILEANLLTARLMDLPRSALVKQPLSRFVLNEDQDIYCLLRKQIFETLAKGSGQAGEPQECDLRLVRPEGVLLWVHLAGIAVQAEDGAPVCRMVLSNISECKQAEEERKKKFNEINRIGLITNSSLDLDIVLNLILENTTKAMNASVGMIFTKDLVSGYLTWGASLGLSEDFVKDFNNKPIQIGEGLTGTIAQTREPIFISADSSHDSRIKRSIIHKEGLNSFLGVPIIARGEVVGVMNILTRPPEQLSEQDIPFCCAIGSQVGLALLNAQLYTAQKEAQEALREQYEFSESLIETAQAIILVLDTQGRIVRFTSYMKDLVGYDLHEVKGMDWFENFLKPEDDKSVKSVFQKTVDGFHTSGIVNSIIAKDGRTILVEWNNKALKDKDGRIVGVLAVGQDITERMQMESQLRAAKVDAEAANLRLAEISATDGLTGIANRRRFDEIAAVEWARSVRSGNPLALLLLDVDQFKAYNDNYGHLAGDEVLKHVANVLREKARRPSDFVARYGGEEFVVIAADTSAHAALTMAESIKAGIEALALTHEYSTHGVLTVSIGVAVATSGSPASLEVLLGMADTALYKAKNAGRNRIELAEPELYNQEN